MSAPKVGYPFAPPAQDWLYDKTLTHGAFRMLAHLALKVMHAKNLAYKFKRPLNPNGIVLDVDEIATLFDVTTKTVQNWVKEGLGKGYLITIPDKKVTFVQVRSFAKINGEEIFFLDSENNFSDSLGANTGAYKEGENTQNPPIDTDRLLSLRDNANDPTGTFADALSFEEPDDSHITHTRTLHSWVPVDMQFIGDESLDASSENIGNAKTDNDKNSIGGEKSAKNGQYVAPDGVVWGSLDEWFNSLPADAPDETEPRRVWTNDEGEDDPKRTPMTEIERLIVGWMKAHGSKINRLSAQSVNKLKSRLANSNETLVMVGAELWKSPEVQKRLAGIANRPSAGHKTAFNQNEVVNMLMDEYQAWRKTRDAQRANPEIAELEVALVEALGFKMNTIPANALIYLRDTVIPQIFAGGCRAHHAKPLIDGMKERKTGFIIGEWTARKKDLEKAPATVSMEIIGGDDRIGSL